MSHVIGLRCLRCGNRQPPDPDAYVCPECGADPDGGDPGILDVQYDYEAAGDALAADMAGGAGGERAAAGARAADPGAPRAVGAGAGPRHDLFRYLPLLPLDEPGSVLPAGGTPLVPASRLADRLGLGALYLKDETRNPTRCLKDRATAVGVSMALARGHEHVYCASAGNAAISLAGFAAHLGLQCHVFVPSYASPVRLAWLRRYGADVRVSEGDYDRAYAEAEAEGRANGWYSRNCALNPFLVEGKKTAALEVVDQLGGRAPDWVVSPAGDGCTLGALGKGFREAWRLGRSDARPRLLGVQAEGVRPLVRRFHAETAEDASGADASGAETADVDEPGETAAVSMAVRRPRNARRVLDEVRASGGTMLAVTDDEVAAAQTALAEDAGVVAEFTSAATLAGLQRLARQEPLADRTVVLVITGGRLDQSPEEGKP